MESETRLGYRRPCLKILCGLHMHVRIYITHTHILDVVAHAYDMSSNSRWLRQNFEFEASLCYIMNELKTSRSCMTTTCLQAHTHTQHTHKEKNLTLVPRPTPLLISSHNLGTSSPRTETSRYCRHFEKIINKKERLSK